jgi:predicted transporter
MTFISVTWSFLIITIIILFGTMNGLGIALKKISKLNFAFITLIYAIVIFVLLFIIGLNNYLSYDFFNHYIAEITGILGLLIFLAGILTIKNWKCNKEITYLNNPAFTVPVIGGTVGVTSVYALLIGPNSGNNIELMLTIFFGLLLIIFIAFGVSKFLKKLEKPYPIIVTNFMVLVGFFFIMFAAFIPNIATLSNLHMNPLYIRSTDYVAFLVIAVAGIFLCGVFIQNMRMQKETML